MAIGIEHLLRRLDTDDRAPAAGPRTVNNSPEYFPRLGIPTCRFLHGLVTVATSLENRYADSTTSGHIPLNVQRITDIAEGLIRKRGEGSEAYTPTYRFDYFRLQTRHHTVREVDPHEINTLEMAFSPTGHSANESTRVYFHPNTRRQYDKYKSFEDLPLDEVLDILSSRRMSAERVAQVIAEYNETRASLEIVSDNAELELIFCEGEDITVTSAGRDSEPAYSKHFGLVQCRLSMTIDTRRKELAGVLFPFSAFCGTRAPQAREQMEEVLRNCALDLAIRAKPNQKV